MLVLLWSAGFLFFIEHMVDLGGFWGLVDLAWVYLTVILIIFLTVRGWNVYNFSKYGKKNRRIMVRPVSAKEMEEFLKMPTAALEHIQNWNTIKVDFMAHHHLKFSSFKDSSTEPIPAEFTPS